MFHEGYKYWSCCDKRRTIDFDSFLAYTGCQEEEKCKWFKDPDEVELRKPCRHDWYETAADVVVEVLAKLPTPEKTTVKVNPDTLLIDTVYEGTNRYALRFDLAGKIDVAATKVQLFSTKINIKLKKAEGGKWETLGEVVDVDDDTSP